MVYFKISSYFQMFLVFFESASKIFSMNSEKNSINDSIEKYGFLLHMSCNQNKLSSFKKHYFICT